MHIKPMLLCSLFWKCSLLHVLNIRHYQEGLKLTYLSYPLSNTHSLGLYIFSLVLTKSKPKKKNECHLEQWMWKAPWEKHLFHFPWHFRKHVAKLMATAEAASTLMPPCTWMAASLEGRRPYHQARLHSHSAHNTPWPQTHCFVLGLAPAVHVSVSTHRYQLTIMSSDWLNKSPRNHETPESQFPSTFLTWARMQTLTPSESEDRFCWKRSLLPCQNCTETVNCCPAIWERPKIFYQCKCALRKIK